MFAYKKRFNLEVFFLKWYKAFLASEQRFYMKTFPNGRLEGSTWTFHGFCQKDKQQSVMCFTPRKGFSEGFFDRFIG